MTIKQYKAKLANMQRRINNYVKNDLPLAMGSTSIRHFQNNFLKGGYVNNGFHPWAQPKRLSSKSQSARNSAPTLLSSRKRLYNSFSFKISGNKVIVGSYTPYSKVHNEGFRGVQNIRPHHRSRTWASNIQTRQRVKVGGNQVSGYARRVVIPKRQFMGVTPEIKTDIVTQFQQSIKKITSGQ